MALIYAEGFEGWADADDLATTEKVTQSNGVIEEDGIGPSLYTQQDWRAASRTSYVWWQDPTLGATTFITGVHLKVNSFAGTYDFDNGMFGIPNGTGAHSPGSGLVMNNDAYPWGIGFSKAGVIQQDYGHIINNDTWYFFEMKFVQVSGSTWDITVRKDGVQIGFIDDLALPFSSVDDCAIAGIDGSLEFDNWYICDGTGTTNNDFLGKVACIGLAPRADSRMTDWSTTTTSGYQALIDTGEYISTGIPSAYSYFSMDQLSALEGIDTVHGVRHLWRTVLGEAGSGYYKPFIRYNSVNDYGSEYSIGTSSVTDYVMFDAAPDGTSWTPTKVDSSFFGFDYNGDIPYS